MVFIEIRNGLGEVGLKDGLLTKLRVLVGKLGLALGGQVPRPPLTWLETEGSALKVSRLHPKN